MEKYWNFINPGQKNYVSLVNNNKCLTVNNGNSSDGIQPSFSECKEQDINQEWLFNNNQLKNRSSTTCLGKGKMYSCNNDSTNWHWSINSLKNNYSQCLTSNNNKIDLQDCDFTNKNQSWKEKAPFLNDNIKTSELTTTFSDLYYNLQDENKKKENTNNLFWNTRRYKPLEKNIDKDRYIEIINN